jgi:hypothetical protein
MKVKLDGNLPLRIAIELRARSNDVQTVVEEASQAAEQQLSMCVA